MSRANSNTHSLKLNLASLAVLAAAAGHALACTEPSTGVEVLHLGDARGPGWGSGAERGGASLPEVLEQGWDDATREAFWFTPQGAELVPYAWFLMLERPDSAEPMRSASSMESYRHIPMPSSARNPDGLPIGFTKDRDPETGQEFLGLTCAACHTAKLELAGHEVLIEGAPTLADFKRFLRDLKRALLATEQDPAKFARFAAALEQVAPAGGADLRAQLRAQIARLDGIERNDTTSVPYGFARLDAFGAILNYVAAVDLHMPENAAPPNAPVSYPFVWDTPHADRVQWNGAARNVPLVGPLIRNIGEVLGVFGRLEIEPARSGWTLGYEHSVHLENLGKLENWLKELWSPVWPSEYLPAIEAPLAERGARIYDRECSSCHAILDSRNPARQVRAVMTSVPSVGTDPVMAKNYLERMAKTGPLEGQRLMIVAGPRFSERARTFELVINGVSGVLLRDPLRTLTVGLGDVHRTKQLRRQGTAPEAAPTSDAAARPALEASLKRYVAELEPFDARTFSYKARPLNGIWATAPYLHNGSVPNLWALLQPAEARPKRFWVGSRAFDPQVVGLVSEPSSDAFELDVTLEGNSNAGHAYGTALSDDEKWALIEFLKTL